MRTLGPDASGLANQIALKVRGLDDDVLIALIADDPDVKRMAAAEAARRMIAERPRP
jgi:hypothetical protein